MAGYQDISLNQRSDDFSEQFSIDSDLRFWIRIDLPFSETVSVSDLLFGDQSDRFVCLALLQAFARIGVERPKEIVFRNLGALDDPKTAAVAQRIESVLEAMVSRQWKFVVGRNFEITRRKVDLVVEFEHLD